MDAKERPYRSTEFDPVDQTVPELDGSPDEEAVAAGEEALAAHEAEEILASLGRGEGSVAAQ